LKLVSHFVNFGATGLLYGAVVTCREIQISLRGTRFILNTLWYDVDIIGFYKTCHFAYV